MTITALPTPPSRADSSNFASRGDAFMAALPAFATEVNAAGTQINNAIIASMAGVTATSTSSVLIGLGIKTFTTEAGKGFVIGQTLKAASSADPSNHMTGTVTSYSGTALAISVASTGGSGTLASWSISIELTVAATGTIPIGGLLSMTGQGSSFTDSGATYLKTGVIASAATYPLAPAFTLADAATWVARTGVNVAWGRGGSFASNNSITVVTSLALVTTYMTTTDGITLTSRSFPTTGYWKVAYGNGIFLAVDYAPSTTVAYTSTDGINWTSRTITANATGYGKPVFGNGLFVIPSGNTAWLTTTDGVTYTATTGIAAAASNGASAFGNGVFVVIGSTNNTVLVSLSGTAWNSVPVSGSAIKVVFGNGKFVLLSSSANGAFATSDDGVVWFSDTPAATLASGFTDVAFGNGTFLFVNGYSSATHYTTTDFTSWVPVTAPSSTSWDMAFFSTAANAFGILDSNTTTAATSITSGSYTGSINAVFAGKDTTKPYYMRVA